jgi:hypothetical protein
VLACMSTEARLPLVLQHDFGLACLPLETVARDFSWMVRLSFAAVRILSVSWIATVQPRRLPAALPETCAGRRWRT